MTVLAGVGNPRNTGRMKARWTMKCECCKETISIGSQYVMFRGRPWKPAHTREYLHRRNARIRT